MIYSPISLSSDLSIADQFNIWFNFSKNSQFFINFPMSLFLLLFCLFYVLSIRNLKKVVSLI